MERGNRRERERGRTGRGPRVAMIRATKRYKRDDVARGSVAERRRQKWSGERRRSKVEKERCDRDCEEGQSADCTLGSGERGKGEGGTESVAIMTENCALPGSAAQHRHLIQFNCDTVQ